jgi:hypothetical protein
VANSEISAHSVNSPGIAVALNWASGQTLSLAHTKLDGSVWNEYGGTVRCTGNYNVNYAPVTCP